MSGGLWDIGRGMTSSLSWTDVAIRLALTVLAGMLVGYNRSEHGKAAGMRTTLLVCLAASVAMIQVNLLLPTAGRHPDSFVMNDPMRLPLGILTGVGFIGGGAVLRRGNIVVGVTTAATLWLVTVIGLCLGGGQIVLGLAATALGLFALWVLKWLESSMLQQVRVRFSICLDADGPDEAEIRHRLKEAGHTILGSRITREEAGKYRELVFELQQFRRYADSTPPAVLDALSRQDGVVKLQWDSLR
jgi:putative Mg2+ transporter-C (MgtC) family protein